MKIKLMWIGKTNEKYLKEGIEIYLKRLKHYCTISTHEIKDVKKFSTKEDLKIKEGQAFLEQIQPSDFVVLLDEKGKQKTSIEFSNFFEHHQNVGTKSLIFIIGGAFGFSKELYQRSNLMLSLSKMTFSHQMIRVFFYEQVYRAFTILRNEKYHNE